MTIIHIVSSNNRRIEHYAAVQTYIMGYDGYNVCISVYPYNKSFIQSRITKSCEQYINTDNLILIFAWHASSMSIFFLKLSSQYLVIRTYVKLTLLLMELFCKLTLITFSEFNYRY